MKFPSRETKKKEKNKDKEKKKKRHQLENTALGFF